MTARDPAFTSVSPYLWSQLPLLKLILATLLSVDVKHIYFKNIITRFYFTSKSKHSLFYCI